MPENGSGPSGTASSSLRRFYQEARAEERDGGYALALDGRPARTPGRSPLILPGRALAEAVVAEWNGQGPAIDPGTMPLTRLANTAIDGVAPEAAAVADGIVRYAGSDLVCYRADGPDTLVREQANAWDPVLGWARDALDARFVLSQGVMFVTQPDGAIAKVRSAVTADLSPFRLTPLHVMTTLTGSALLALMLDAGKIATGDAWRAAHGDELHQERLWGQDADALARRNAREAEFDAASRFLRLWRAP